MRTISSSPTSSPWVSSLTLSMNRSIDCGDARGSARAATAPSNVEGIASNSSCADADDARHVADRPVVVRAVDGRDELVAGVLDGSCSTCRTRCRRSAGRTGRSRRARTRAGTASCSGRGRRRRRPGAGGRAAATACPVQSTRMSPGSSMRERLVGVTLAGDALDRPGAAALDELAERLLDRVERRRTPASTRRAAPAGRARSCAGRRGASRARSGRRSPRRSARRSRRPCSSRSSRRRGSRRATPSGSACTRRAARRAGRACPSIDWRSAARNRPTGPAPTTWTRPMGRAV